MAKWNDPKPTPNYEIYDFATDFNQAFAACTVAHNLKEAAKQGDSKALETPYFKVKLENVSQYQRSYLVPGTVDPDIKDPITRAALNIPWGYPNFFKGSMEVSVLTNRKRAEQKLEKTHSAMVGFVRCMMALHDRELSNRMKYCQIVQLIQTTSRESFDPATDQDLTSIGATVEFCILPSAFPKPE